MLYFQIILIIIINRVIANLSKHFSSVFSTFYKILFPAARIIIHYPIIVGEPSLHNIMIPIFYTHVAKDINIFFNVNDVTTVFAPSTSFSNTHSLSITI